MLSNKRQIIRLASDLVKPTITFIIIITFITRHSSVSFSIQSLPSFHMSRNLSICVASLQNITKSRDVNPFQSFNRYSTMGATFADRPSLPSGC